MQRRTALEFIFRSHLIVRPVHPAPKGTTVIWLAPLSGFVCFFFIFFSVCLSICSHTSSPFFFSLFFSAPITHFSFYHRQAKQARMNERRGGRRTNICFPPNINLCCTGGMPSFSSTRSFMRDTYFFPEFFKQTDISIYFFSLSLSLCSPSLHPPNSVFFLGFGPLHPDMYNMTSSRAGRWQTDLVFRLDI